MKDFLVMVRINQRTELWKNTYNVILYVIPQNYSVLTFQLKDKRSHAAIASKIIMNISHISLPPKQKQCHNKNIFGANIIMCNTPNAQEICLIEKPLTVPGLFASTSELIA